MGKYIERINDYFTETKCDDQTKMEWISTTVFGFSFYDGNIDEIFSRRMIDVIEAIVNKRTYEYQDKSQDNYIGYLVMVNMPFLKNKIDWGTSIRGVWFDKYPQQSIYFIGEIPIPGEDIEIFMSDLIEWSKTEFPLGNTAG